MINVDHSLCIGCGLCVSDCFPGALSLNNDIAALTIPDRCIGCGHCIAVCPLAAISDSNLTGDDIVSTSLDLNDNDLLTLMRSRRSCRHYKNKPVPNLMLSRIIDAARACPTAKNLQATRYIAVTRNIHVLLDEALYTLGEIGNAQRHTTNDPSELRRAENFIRWSIQRQQDKTFDPLFFHAPQLLLFVAQDGTSQDAAAAAAYSELMAASLGLGCLYSGYFTACISLSLRLRELLNLQDDETVVRCLVLGYPDIHFHRSAPRKQPNITYL